jgi:hypothetical protein
MLPADVYHVLATLRSRLLRQCSPQAPRCHLPVHPAASATKTVSPWDADWLHSVVAASAHARADREVLPIDHPLFGDRPVSPSSQPPLPSDGRRRQAQLEGTFVELLDRPLVPRVAEMHKVEFCRESRARPA